MSNRTAEQLIQDTLNETNVALKQTYSVIGPEVAEYMKGQIEQFSDGKRLKATITYATEDGVVGATEGGAPKSYLIKKAGPMELHIGTAAPFAKYVNYGALPWGQGIGTQDPEAQGTFFERMEAWWCDELGHGRSSEEVATSRAIAMDIIKNGTDPNPFFESSVVFAEQVTPKALRAVFKKVFDTDLARKCKTKIEITMDLTKGTKGGYTG